MARALGRSPAGHRLAYAVFTEGRPGGMQAASLSVPRRVDLAQKALRQHPLCRWAGFDPELNEVKSNELRAASAVIVFAITCRGWAKAG